MSATSLREAFLGALPATLREPLAGLAGLEEQLAAAVQEAAAVWPELPLAPVCFAAHLGACLPEAAGADPRPLSGLRLADLHLACACTGGVPGAARALEACCIAGLAPAIAGLGLDASQVEEVRQILRTRLLVGGPGEPPLISRYGGRGPLPAWVRVVGLRVALQLLRRGRRELPLEEQMLEAMPLSDGDPELHYIRDLYREDFRQALQEALRALTPRQTNILSHHYLDGLTTHELGVLYRVNQSTAARWLERARQAILAGTRSGLERRLGARPEEVESIMRLVHSRLDLTLRGLLGHSGNLR